MLETIKGCIRAAGCVCYDTAEKIDVCKSPYVVCYDHGVEVLPRTKGMLGSQVYEVVCLTPFDDVKSLPVMADTVKRALKTLDAQGLRLSSSSGTGIEETFKARAVSLSYALPVRLF